MRSERESPLPNRTFPPLLLREMALLIGATHYMWESKTAEEALAWMRRIESSLDEEPWANGKHSGDCTQTAHTCARCFIEDFERQADELLSSEDFGFVAGDFPEWELATG